MKGGAGIVNREWKKPYAIINQMIGCGIRKDIFTIDDS